ncbi:MAG: protein-ADP-ribose hydrolase [Lachnospiraceae bacterium]|nr:protein-ADP-ribose hydrolase [Lachnospiraceae bacterium]
MNQSERRLFLIKELLKDNSRYSDMTIPLDTIEQKSLLRGLMNIRMPHSIDRKFLEIQDSYLQEEIRLKGITDASDLKPVKNSICVWQGDITLLKCDAIVNAANSGMTGCYYPNHRCIDNCIHTFAGIQLRQKCNEIMLKQGYEEPTGLAKITPAYNLPCKYILHTVGPIIYGNVSENDCELLKSCYLSCLKLAVRYELESVAFCCISTGEFHFPNDEAAKIAVETVENFLQKQSVIKRVIFNVFKDIDKTIYERLLSSN